eukprot:369536_1
METFLSKNQFIDENQRNIVYGYMRNIQRWFIKRKNHLIIPSLVIHKILYFYHNETVESFDLMYLKPDLLRGIYAYGVEKPSKIQQRAILPIIQNHDVMVQARAGTGKTCTFSIAALQKVDVNQAQCQVLILVPTRELALCINHMIKSLGTYLNVTTHACTGGCSVREDIHSLSRGVHIVVGTPGRVNDMISRGALELKALKLFVVDESYEMLCRGFQELIYDAFQCLPSEVQVALFSATKSKVIVQLTEIFMRDPIHILLEGKKLTLDNVKQYYVAVDKEEYKLETLFDLFECVPVTKVVIYCNTQRKVMWLKDKMQQPDNPQDVTVFAIHSNMDQKERDLAIQEFKYGASRVLIRTDVSPREPPHGDYVALIINYDLPLCRENYIHRIGTSGSRRTKMVAINFVCDKEESILRDLETFYNTRIDELPADVDSIMGSL